MTLRLLTLSLTSVILFVCFSVGCKKKEEQQPQKLNLPLHTVKIPEPMRPKTNNTGKVVADEVFVYIAGKNNAAALERFEKAGIDINIQQPGTGYTPFVVAARACNIEMVKYLDQRKADMTIEVYSSNNVLKSAYLNAATEGCLPVVRYFIEEKKVDINMHSDVWRETALYKAAEGNFLELANYLLSKGIDTSLQNNNGITALDIARKKGNTAIAAAIEKAQKEPKKK